jgi:hypothetical protein
MEDLERTSPLMLKKSALINYENKQNKFAVFSIAEAIILAIKKKMPSIEKIVFSQTMLGFTNVVDASSSLSVLRTRNRNIPPIPHGNQRRKVLIRCPLRSIYATDNILVK